MHKNFKQKKQVKDVIITIKRLGINGEGIGYYKKKIIFIPKALPGEIVVAKIIKEYPHYLLGELVRIKQKSPDRVDFPKEVSPEVGGLELAHLDYAAQLKFKKDNVIAALEKYHPRNYRNYKIKNTLAAPDKWQYRNKAQYQVEQDHHQIKLGLFAPNSHELYDLPQMPTQNPATQKTERAILKLLGDLHIGIANPSRHLPGIKTVVVRQSESSQEIQVTLITVGKNIKNLSLLTDKIMKLPHVVSLFQNETDWRNPQVWGNKTIKLAGKDKIIEEVLDCKFALSPRAFYQLNSKQTATLYFKALQFLDLKANQTLIDAYSGVGTLGILAAKEIKEVISIETVPESVNDADYNAHLNNLQNITTYQGSVEKVLPQLTKEGLQFDALIVDPPRTGLAKSLIKTILQTKPQTFVYISCNPSSLAKDLVLLTQDYDVRLIENIDMLPQTPRCECVVKLTLRK